ncbi:MAG TPA: M14 family metallopeptidase [Candidatus Saccharimonadales bacterium]
MVKPRLKQWWAKFISLPTHYTIPSVVLAVLCILYGVIFLLEKPVTFSYSQPTCVRHFTFLPTIMTTTTSGYRAYASDLIKIGNLPVASLSTCVAPLSAPQEGKTQLAIAPFGSLFAKKTFTIETPSAPTADVALFSRPVPISRPLAIPLDKTDTIFSYNLRVEQKEIICSAQENATACDVAKLGLAQGKPYLFQLKRSFKGKEVATLAKKEIMTLPATKVVASSIKPAETVFAKPRVIELQFDKKITTAKPKLFSMKDGKKTPIKMGAEVSGDKIQLTLDEDLARQTDHELVVESVEAEDGSGLDGAFVLPFKMSGGPRVSSINIGTTGVTAGSAVITFDQPVADNQDASKIITVSGGATITSLKGTQLVVNLGGVPRCGDFAIKINDTLKSSFDIIGGSTWQHTARTLCHTVRTIGYSSRGRAINAYYFGNGGTSVLYTGAIHGSESNTRDLMRQWIDYLEANARSIPADKTVVVVPEINPDGTASRTRTNARNVDLNRNFATGDWKKDITTVNNTPFPGGGGESPMSEPETRAIAGLASQLRPRIILSFHSVGGVVAANQAGDSGAKAAQYASLSGYGNVTGSSDSTFEYSVTGTADDWYAQQLGVPSILVELSSSYSSQFSRNQKAMWAMLN